MADEEKGSGDSKAYLLILRWTIAFIFLIHGFQKFHDPAFASGASDFFISLKDDVIFGPYKRIFKEIIVPNAHLFALLVKYGEMAVGLGFLLGTPLRISATAGIFLNFNYLMIASIPSLIYLNLLMIVCQFVIVGTHRSK